MTLGEQLFLGLVLVAFAAFGVSLAIVQYSTERYLRSRSAEESAGAQDKSLPKTA